MHTAVDWAAPEGYSGNARPRPIVCVGTNGRIFTGLVFLEKSNIQHETPQESGGVPSRWLPHTSVLCAGHGGLLRQSGFNVETTTKPFVRERITEKKNNLPPRVAIFFPDWLSRTTDTPVKF